MRHLRNLDKQAAADDLSGIARYEKLSCEVANSKFIFGDKCMLIEIEKTLVSKPIDFLIR